MAYAKPADLELRLGNIFRDLYFDAFSAAVPDLTIPQADLDAAAGEIDGMIGVRFAVPVTAAASEKLLCSWNVTLAEELAWARSGKSETPQNVQDRVKQVRELLQKVCTGEMLLPGAEQSGTSGGGSVVCIDGNTPVFGRRNMKGY